MSTVRAPERVTRPRQTVPARQHDRRRRVKPGGRGSGRRLLPSWPAGWRAPRYFSRRTVLVAAAVAVVLAVLLGWLVLFSSLLGVRTVEVTGSSGATAAAVREVAAIPDGMPLARVDTDGVAERLAMLPQVESVSVDRSWPSTVRIEVVERRALALVDVDGMGWLVDRTGTLFAQVTEPPAGVPTLQVADAGPGDRATMAALEVMQVLPADIRERVSVVSAESTDSVVLQLVGGRTVVWGSATDSERKALVLAGVFDRPGTTIDVSSPSAVVIR